MKKNLIAISKNKLSGIDGLLPVLMEVKALYPDIKISIVLYDDKHYRLIKKNYNMWDIIKSLNASVYVIRAKNHFITLIRLVSFILRFSFCRNIIIKNSDNLPFHKISLKLLKIISKTKEIKAYLKTISQEGARIAFIDTTVYNKRRGVNNTENFFAGDYDHFLSSISAELFSNIYNINPPKDKMINTGYIHGLSQWNSFINVAAKKNGVINKGGYFLYILTSLRRLIKEYETPEIGVFLKESLSILKGYNDRIRTVFRPHVITEMDEFKKVLKELNYTNYVIDYGHPMVLASKAQFVFGNYFSDTMFDAYLLGKPIVEYTQYDKELFERIGRRSLGGECCDFFIQRDKEGLKKALDTLISGDAGIAHDSNFIKNNFLNAPKEFYEFWQRWFQ